MRTRRLKDGTCIPVLGQGTWYMGEDEKKREDEIAALRYGIENGMTLIDTAEMYGDGAAEKLVGEAVRPFKREDLFLVSKVYPWNAGRRHIFKSCENSLKRLGTDHLDLYLLHWMGTIPLAETVRCMEELVKEGKIRRWGVSNLDVEELELLLSLPGGENCQTDQVLYHLGSRGAEVRLLPFMKKQGMPLMAYCPLAQAGKLQSGILRNEVLKEIAAARGVSVFQILLAFSIRDEDVFAIPKAASVSHVRENIEAEAIILSEKEAAALNEAFPAPEYVFGLDMA